ncbi:MAG TPA: GNAT family N-acetyltransferase [Thermoplasmata archaeon]|nr:GNAT family N-acetyltransferase [Thermoplasmata archaeon]
MPPLGIEPLRSPDAHAYWSVFVAGRTNLPTRSVAAHVDRYLTLPTEEQRTHFAVREGDAIVGAMRLLPGTITGFSMDPAHRRDGSAAIIKAIDLLRTQGNGAITASFEDAYQRDFESLGFRRVFSRMRMEGATRRLPGPGPTLKPPEEGEVPKLATFFRDVYEGHMEQAYGLHVGSVEYWREFVTGILRGGTGRFMPEASFVALEGERLTGAILVAYWMEGPLVAELGVVPDRRRQGVARALLSAASTRLVALEEPRWALYVTEGNEPAIRLYRAFGFEQVGGQTVTARLDAATE